jgi:tetratricopeptide (TPR) repeat protein
MKKLLIILLLSPLLWRGAGGDAFSQKLDPLWSIYKNKAQSDTNRLKAIDDIAWSYNDKNSDTAIILAKEELQLANTLPNDKGKAWTARALNTIGTSFCNKGDYPKALEYYLKVLTIREEIGDKRGIGSCYRNIGLIYGTQSNYPKALDYDLKALKICEQIGDKHGIADCYGFIGQVYKFQTDYSKALEYYLKALKIDDGLGDKYAIGTCYMNIGALYDIENDLPKALEYDVKVLKIREEMDDKPGIGNAYVCLGAVYQAELNDQKVSLTERNKYGALALAYTLKAMQIKKQIGNKPEIGRCYINLSVVYHDLKDYNRSLLYADSTLQLKKEIADINIVGLAYQVKADVYAITGRYKEAYENHVKFKTLTDSIFNADNSKQLGDMKTKFEVDKKEAELKVKSEAEQEKLKAVSLEEKKRQQVIIYAVAGVLVLVMIFSIFLFNRFRITQKQKQVIEDQKVLVDKAYQALHEKNKEVIDSIMYAKRIQTALLPTEKYIEKSIIRLIKRN